MTLIQPILIACVALGVGVYFWKLRSSSLDRVIVLTIAAFGMLLVAFPTLSIRLANRVGVGRGADLVTILLVRRLEQRRGMARADGRLALVAPLVPSLLVALAVAWADFQHANTARTAAVELGRRYAGRAERVWFHGSWGFHYYMEAAGVRRFDVSRTQLRPGDIVILASHVEAIGDSAGVTPLDEISIPRPGWIAAWAPIGAGFHSEGWGPLPFAFGAAPPEIYAVRQIRNPARLGGARRSPRSP